MNSIHSRNEWMNTKVYNTVVYLYILDITSIFIDLFELWSNGISFMLLDESCKTNKCAFYIDITFSKHLVVWTTFSIMSNAEMDFNVVCFRCLFIDICNFFEVTAMFFSEKFCLLMQIHARFSISNIRNTICFWSSNCIAETFVNCHQSHFV